MALNEQLISINASHSIYVERLARGFGSDALPFIDKVSSQVAARLERETGKNLTPARRKKLLQDINAITADNLKDYTKQLGIDHKAFGGYESGFQAKSLNGLLVNVETVAATTTAVNAAAKSTLIKYGEGSYTTYNQMLKKYWSDNATAIENIVGNGFVNGKSTRELTNQVMNEVGTKLKGAEKSAKMIARTGTNHYANQARKTYFEENDVIIGTRRIATIDSSTSGYCRSIDQTVVLKSGSKYKSAFAPFHPNCRTANVPEVNGKYAIDDDDSKRASNFKVDGTLDPKPVDSKKIYYEQMATLDAQSQDDILGPTLGKAFRKMKRDGGTPSEFAKLTVNEKLNKTYTITELKKQDNVLADILNAQAKK